MTILHVNESYGGLPNSGRLSGTNGDLVGILDVALVAAGWTITFTSGNSRVYRTAGGNRLYMYVGDDSAVSGAATIATVRGCESASAVGTANLTNPFPTSAQFTDANSNWVKSSTANTTARTFDMWISDRWIYYVVNVFATTYTEVHFFGDLGTTLAADTFGTACFVRATTVVSNSQGLMQAGNNGTLSPAKPIFIDRSFDGSVLSCKAFWLGVGSGASMRVPTTATSARSGVSGKVDMIPVQVNDPANGTLASSVSPRAFLPNFWFPQHSGPGTIATRDTFTATGYNPSASFNAIVDVTGLAFGVIETTDTWSVPVA